MTPVEIFSPHFSHALARYISREALKTANAGNTVAPAEIRKRKKHPRNGLEHNTSRRKTSSAGDRGYDKALMEKCGDRRDVGGEGLIVYEVGGGSGTNALNVLNWLQREEPELYGRTEYTIVEISERLAARQRERVCAVHTVSCAMCKRWGLTRVLGLSDREQGNRGTGGEGGGAIQYMTGCLTAFFSFPLAVDYVLD